MAFWKSQAFKALQQEWYERLKSEGFQDAEKLIGNEPELRQTAGHPYRHTKCALDKEAKEEYYILLSQSVQEGEFRNEIDAIILVLYAEGNKIKTICDKLQEIGKRRCRKTIMYTIRRYEMKWKIREYTPKQLRRKEA